MRGKCGAAHAHDARVLHGSDEVVERQRLPVRRRHRIDFLRGKWIRFDADCGRKTAVDAPEIPDARDRARDRAVQRRRHEAARFRDEITAHDLLALRDGRPRRHADVLAQRHHVVLAERHALDREVLGLFLVMRRVNPVFEAAAQEA